MNTLVSFALLLAAAEGDTYVVDAGTLVISGNAVHLRGIDLPGSESDAGKAAKQTVEDLIEGHTVTCRLEGVYVQGYGDGVCFVDGVDIAETLISDGKALDCTRTSWGRYRALEVSEARLNLPRSADCAPGFVRP